MNYWLFKLMLKYQIWASLFSVTSSPLQYIYILRFITTIYIFLIHLLTITV